MTDERVPTYEELVAENERLRGEAQHPQCFQHLGIPDGAPPDLCDCRILRMLTCPTECVSANHPGREHEQWLAERSCLNCPGCGSGEEGCCVCQQMLRAEAAEAALVDARAQVEALDRRMAQKQRGLRAGPVQTDVAAIRGWCRATLAALSSAAADTP